MVHNELHAIDLGIIAAYLIAISSGKSRRFIGKDVAAW